MGKINIAEILKDCQKGMELYSPILGKCRFDSVNETLGRIIVNKAGDKYTFTHDGRYLDFDDGECVLFPSKENRDWSTFQISFNRGDIIYTCCNSGHEYISIFNECINDIIHIFATISNYQKFCTSNPLCYFSIDVKVSRLATEEEKQKLFDAIKANGYKWNAETKTLEELIVPKFKVGDRIRSKQNHSRSYKIYQLTWNNVCNEYSYKLIPDNDNQYTYLNISEQDNYELVPNKFDISTLKSFDKVLVRSYNSDIWVCCLFST